MLRPYSKAALVALALACGAATASAQFGSIFGDPPPRPPSSVPGGRQQFPTPAPSYSTPPPSYGQPGAPPPPTGGIQSRPLAPPPGGSAAIDPGAATAPQALPGGAPGQRPPRAPAPPPEPLPDEAYAEPQTPKIPNTSALFSGLDKITGRIINFDVAIGETVQFGALQLTPRACYTRPPTELPNTDAFIEVDEVTLQGEVRRIFTGWMYAASPGLHGVEHPIYDLWLTDCKGAAQAANTEKAADPAPAPAAPVQRTPPRPQPKQAPRPQAAPQQPPGQFPQFR
jgi:hypothetical protein